MNHLRHQNYKSKHMKIKYLNNIQNTKVKNSSLELKTDFQPINVSVDNMEKTQKKKTTKKNVRKKRLGTIV